MGDKREHQLVELFQPFQRPYLALLDAGLNTERYSRINTTVSYHTYNNVVR
jgi:hypothetical protein